MSSAADMFSWLRAVQADHRVSAGAFELAFVISQHVNSTSGRAFPTQQTLMKLTRAKSIRNVRRFVAELSAAGYLAVEVNRGRHIPNVYRLSENRTDLSAYLSRKEDTGVRLLEQKSGQILHEKRTNPARKADAHVLQNQPQELTSGTSSDPKGRDAGASASALDENPKAILFGDGLTWLAEKTGRSPATLRTAIGQMLKIARDDAGHVLAIIRQARREDRADPVSWTMGVLRDRQLGAVPRRDSARAPANVPAGLLLSKAAARA